jgi:hypothetical protein
MPLQSKGAVKKKLPHAKLGGNFNCCGLYELDGIEDREPVESVFHYWNDFVNNYGYSDYSSAPYVVFTSAYSDGPKLAEYIKKHKLGDVLAGPGEGRCNSTGSSDLRAWMWLPVADLGRTHWKEFDKYFTKEFGEGWKQTMGVEGKEP